MKQLPIVFKILISSLLVLLLLFALPRPDYPDPHNPWLKSSHDDRPLVIAHAGGKGHFPDNTMSAFEYSYDLGVDVLEMDVQMTSDNILVLRHGENDTGNIRQLSNCDTVIWNETYEYLYQNCNFGYNYEVDGEYPYRDLTFTEWVDAKVYLLQLDELFEEYGNTTLYNIEIKADADSPRTEIADALYTLIDSYDLFDNVLVATSFHDISEYIATEYPLMQLSTSEAEAQTMIIHSYSLTSFLYRPQQYASLQLPTTHGVPVLNELNLATGLLVSNAHRHNMAVHYWTINDPEEMKRLIDIGCDGIITDYPEVLMEVIEQALQNE